MSQCNYRGQPVRLLFMGGHFMAVDREPSPDGTVQLSRGQYVRPCDHKGGAPLYKWHRCDELRRIDREYKARRKRLHLDKLRLYLDGLKGDML